MKVGGLKTEAQYGGDQGLFSLPDRRFSRALWSWVHIWIWKLVENSCNIVWQTFLHKSSMRRIIPIKIFSELLACIDCFMTNSRTVDVFGNLRGANISQILASFSNPTPEAYFGRHPKNPPSFSLH
jgi:hypothetical protein